MTAVYVYRAYDCRGTALYVGRTTDLDRRLTEHRKHARWFGCVAKIRATVHRNHFAAVEAERREIWDSLPEFNRSLAKPDDRAWDDAHRARSMNLLATRRSA